MSIPQELLYAQINNLIDELKMVEAENARLKAEVERLTEAWVDKKMQEDRDALLQQVERLTKAGDEMARVVSSFGFDEAPIAWNRAKEGKPRA